MVPIPTNKPLVREDKPDLIYKSEDAKFSAVVEDIAERHAAGQPVLVGTASVSKSEHLSRLLEKKGIPHEVLNAKQHFREAEIVAQAGRVGGVTVATNMAGRGVDIILGGNPEGLALREANARGVDLATDEGAAELQKPSRPSSRRSANGRARRSGPLGGLYVLGSERHESRRIDNQLRGRSGRQGDPGESRFFLSLEDDLMRLFATGAMNWVMGRALPDDVPIEAKMVTKAIERAQNTVEGRNAESRKDVLKYDDVMNEQRKVIYRRRLQIIEGEDLRDETVELLEYDDDRAGGLVVPVGVPRGVGPPRADHRGHPVLPDQVRGRGPGRGQPRSGQVTESILTEALDLYAERDETIPGGEETARQLERDIMLQIIDQRWQDHLAEMDYLREGINLRAMGNQDPLVAYQREGFAMFGKLMDGHRRRLPALRVPRAGAGRAGPRARSRPGQLPGRRRPGPGGRGHHRGLRRRHAGRAGGGGRQPGCPAATAPRPGSPTGLADDGETQVAHREVRPREARPQRAVLVRERQEVQALPRRQLR